MPSSSGRTRTTLKIAGTEHRRLPSSVSSCQISSNETLPTPIFVSLVNRICVTCFRSSTRRHRSTLRLRNFFRADRTRGDFAAWGLLLFLDWNVEALESVGGHRVLVAAVA